MDHFFKSLELLFCIKKEEYPVDEESLTYGKNIMSSAPSGYYHPFSLSAWIYNPYYQLPPRHILQTVYQGRIYTWYCSGCPYCMPVLFQYVFQGQYLCEDEDDYDQDVYEEDNSNVLVEPENSLTSDVCGKLPNTLPSFQYGLDLWKIIEELNKKN